MKRIIALAIIIMLLFTACGKDEFDPEKYVGESLLTNFGMLVDMNQLLYNNVFVLGHLEVDESKAFEKDGKKYAPVTDKVYTSYDVLKNVVESIYTKECAEDILTNYDLYADVDGVFCLDMSKAENEHKGVKWVRDLDGEVELEERETGKYVMEYRFACGKKDEIDEFTFVNTAGGYRLTELQYVD